MHRYLKIAIACFIIAAIGIWLIGCAGPQPGSGLIAPCSYNALTAAVAYEYETGKKCIIYGGNSGHQGLSQGYYSLEIKHAQAYCPEDGVYLYWAGNRLMKSPDRDCFQPGEQFTITGFLQHLGVIP